MASLTQHKKQHIFFGLFSNCQFHRQLFRSVAQKMKLHILLFLGKKDCLWTFRRMLHIFCFCYLFCVALFSLFFYFKFHEGSQCYYVIFLALLSNYSPANNRKYNYWTHNNPKHNSSPNYAATLRMCEWKKGYYGPWWKLQMPTVSPWKYTILIWELRSYEL